MADYTQDLIRLANRAQGVIDLIVDEDRAEELWQALEGLPQEIRLALDSPLRSTEEWRAILDQDGLGLDDFADDAIYHVEPS